jgi:hypothetical protein
MAPRTRYAQNELAIAEFFESQQSHIHTYSEISEILKNYREKWNLPMFMGTRTFISTLLGKSKMTVIELNFPSNTILRYIWNSKPSFYTITATIHDKAYFSHLSAMYLNGLIDHAPKDIYINAEQRERPQNNTELTQEGIDKAFKNRSRVTANIAKVEGYNINLLYSDGIHLTVASVKH